MKKYTYHEDIRIILTGLGKIFNGITLKRYAGDNTEKVIDEITVPVLYSTKSRILHDIVNKSRHIKLPLMCYQYKTVTYNAKQTFNKIDGYITNFNVDPTGKKIPQPIPITIPITTSFLTRFQTEVDQYITTLFSNFYPYVIMSYKHPSNNTEIRCKVTWDGTTSIAEQDEPAATAPQRFEVTANFNVEGWIFKNADTKVGRIYDIHTSFTSVNELSNEWSWLHRQESDPLFTDYKSIYGKPWVRDVSHPVVYWEQATEMSVVGNMFETVTDVVLVEADINSRVYPEDNEKEFTYEYKTPRNEEEKILLVGKNNIPILDKNGKQQWVPKKYTREEKTFCGTPIQFTILDNQRMIITVPKGSKEGWVDLYVLGEFGLGKLSEDSVREYFRDPHPLTKGIHLTE